VFGAGQHAPGTDAGRRLMAHELTHVVQQIDTPHTLSSKLPLAGSALEREADHASANLETLNGTRSIRLMSGLMLARSRLDAPGANKTDAQHDVNRQANWVTIYRFAVDGKNFDLSEEEYRTQFARTVERLTQDFKLIEDEIVYNVREHKFFLKQVRGWAGIVSDIAGKTAPPDINIWSTAKIPIENGRRLLAEGKVERAARQLGVAQDALKDARHEWFAYLNTTGKGAEQTTTTLKFTRDISFAIAISTAAIIVAPVVAAGAVEATTVIGGAAAKAARAATVALTLSTASVPATTPAVTAVAVPALTAVAAPTATAVAGPAVTAVAVPALTAVAAPTTVAAAPALTAVATPSASTLLSLASLATIASSLTLSSDTHQPTGKEEGKKKKKRPPFVLRLPQEKAPHLQEYRNWLGVLQSDPHYERGSTDQLEKWHQELRIGGGTGIHREVYDRGHALGLTGEAGERLIRVPNWTVTREPNSIRMAVDHVVELQFTPDKLRPLFDHVRNYELLDEKSNIASRNRLVANVARERAIQLAADPSLGQDSIIPFDEVQLDGGNEGERWTLDQIQDGTQLDFYEKHRER
jgi:hypothetical protein